MMLTVGMVRMLKGAPLSVMMVLLLGGSPVSAQYICRHSGYGYEAVNEALLLLADYGMVQRLGRYQWQICNGVAQLPLMATLASGEEIVKMEQAEVENQPDGSSEKPKSRAPEPAENAGTSENPKSEFGNSEVPVSSLLVNQNLESIQDLDSNQLARDALNLEKSEVAQALDAHGINEPARGRILTMPGITARVVRYHCQTSQNIGQAIYRIQHGWKVPKTWRDERPYRADPQPVASEPTESAPPAAPECAQHAWKNVLQVLESELSKPNFQTWVSPLWVVEWGNGELVLAAFNAFGRDWVQQRLGARIAQLFSDELGENIRVRIIVGGG